MGLGGNDGSIQLRGPLQCLHLQSVEDKAQLPRMLPGPSVGEYQMDYSLFHTGRNISWLSLLLSSFCLHPKDLNIGRWCPSRCPWKIEGALDGEGLGLESGECMEGGVSGGWMGPPEGEGK